MICFYSEYYIPTCDSSLVVTAKWNGYDIYHIKRIINS